jgi:hypothetical protein
MLRQTVEVGLLGFIEQVSGVQYRVITLGVKLAHEDENKGNYNYILS